MSPTSPRPRRTPAKSAQQRTRASAGPARGNDAVRSDAIRSRERLIEATERLLSSGRVDFSIPELASEAGVGVATAYRHYSTPSEALGAYHDRAAGELVAAFDELDDERDPQRRFDDLCTTWVKQAQLWGPSVRHIRSHQGYLERVDKGNPRILALHQRLLEALEDLISSGQMASQETRAAVLLWVTIFDERVIYDLERHQGWGADEIADYLQTATRAALRINARST